ncbi:MAPEG family protein [Jannaschia ovalis]|uniref:MAPEG family protein n=1 Tax=Jannaschia ovalis TaxID=3038773 RepID=A0ABY8L8G4_9RHOB|nr:MAPEG family protein [Jannaschia sp. GRR-S6-38]WGH77651.1 MAPEG family protein [Jannaschia sp. GRR-S6-38]
MTEFFAPYAHTLAALALWALLQLGLAGVSTVGKARARSAGGLPVRDYSDPAYRRHRAFQNAIETSGAFVAAAVAAMLTGGAPFWVNLLATLFLVARIATAAVHIGTEVQWLRSATWTLGFLCVIGLALIALAGAFAA